MPPGSTNQKINERKHYSLNSYGKGRDLSKSFLQILIRQMVTSNVLNVNLKKFGALQLIKPAMEILSGEKNFSCKVIETKKIMIILNIFILEMFLFPELIYH